MQTNERQSRSKAITAVVLVIAVVLAGNYASSWVLDQLAMDLEPGSEPMVQRAIWGSAVAYCVLMVLPFVPGIEIGLALLMMFGPPIAALVYTCTAVSLTLSFLVGRLIPESALVKLLRDLNLRRASESLSAFAALEKDQRLRALLHHTPSRLLPVLLQHRYLAIAVALNVPGNVVIGGGGGIAMMAGMSRLFTFPAFVLTVAIAVSPVPIAVRYLGVTVG